MLKIHSYGKINLYLDIEGKLPNGYHLIKTVMQSIDLHDEIYIDNHDKNQILIECNLPNIPVNEKNTCYKAAALIKETFNINKGILIKIKKIIPSEAGLAGGSSNSAAVIRGLNELWNLKLTEKQMLEIGLKVGADLPFCLVGGTHLAEGIGEKLTPLKDFVWNDILLVKPDFSLSTAFVYKTLEKEDYNSCKGNKILNHINSSDSKNAALSICNTLEKAAVKIHPQINDIKKLMVDCGALSSAMTGSGSAVFGFFENPDLLNKAYDNISQTYPNTFKTKTNFEGIKLFSSSF